MTESTNTPRQLRTCSGLAALLAGALLFCSFSSSASAQANQPTINGDILTMPVVSVLGQAFRIDFQIVISGFSIDIVLVSFEEVTGADINGAPSFFANVLNVPNLVVDSVSFWGEFSLIDDNPVTFRLLDARPNEPGNSGVEGKWRIAETGISNTCGDDNDTEIFEILVLQQGNQLSVSSPVGIFDATLTGATLQWSGSYPEDGGVTNDMLDVTFSSSLDSFSGTSNWSFTNSTGTCTGFSTFTGILLHN